MGVGVGGCVRLCQLSEIFSASCNWKWPETRPRVSWHCVGSARIKVNKCQVEDGDQRKPLGGRLLSAPPRLRCVRKAFFLFFQLVTGCAALVMTTGALQFAADATTGHPSNDNSNNRRRLQQTIYTNKMPIYMSLGLCHNKNV